MQSPRITGAAFSLLGRQSMVGMGLIMLAVSSPTLAVAIHAQHGAFSYATSEE